MNISKKLLLFLTLTVTTACSARSLGAAAASLNRDKTLPKKVREGHNKKAFTKEAKASSTSFDNLQRRELQAYEGPPTTAPTGSSAPTNAPSTDAPKQSSAPTTARTMQEQCDLKTSFLLFFGYDDVTSMKAGEISASWSPAFVFDSVEEQLVWCGDYTFDIIIAEGEVDFASENKTNAELIEMAVESLSMDVVQTMETNLIFGDLTLGATYSVLVLASTTFGHASFNRQTAVIIVSDRDMVVNENFTRMLNMPEVTDGFSVSMTEEEEGGQIILTVTGSYPDVFNDLQEGDFAYIFEDNGNARMVRPVTLNAPPETGAIQWVCDATGLGEVFDELDFSADVSDQSYLKDPVDDLSDEEVTRLEQEYLSLPYEVRVSLCLFSFDVADVSCVEPEQMRELSHGERRLNIFSDIFNGIKNIVVSIFNQLKDALGAGFMFIANLGETVFNLIKNGGLKLNEELSFVNIDQTAALTCDTSANKGGLMFEASFEIGLQFLLSLKAQFRIEITVKPSLNASIKLLGEVRTRAYTKLGATLSLMAKPDPIEIFRKTTRKTFAVGPVPVLITFRPSAEVFMGVSASVEAEALASLQYGYTFELGFSFDAFRDEKFEKTAVFTQLDPLEEAPEFKLRLNADAEIGVQFTFDILLYELLQATAAADVGLQAQLEVGSTLEATTRTLPFFYVLDTFQVEGFIRVRAEVGLNRDVGEVVRDITNPDEEMPICKFEKRGEFVVPSLSDIENAIPDAIDKAINDARAAGMLVNGAASTFADLKDFFRDNPDPYDSVISTITKIPPFRVQLEIFSDTKTLLSIPEVTIVVASPAFTCVGDSAIVLTVKAESNSQAALGIFDELRGGQWFSDFDGSVLFDLGGSDWVPDDDSANINAFTLRLPRAEMNGLYQIPVGDNATVFLRSTPELLPIPPNGLFSKADLSELFPDIGPFECCEESDCLDKFQDEIIPEGEEIFCDDDKMCDTRPMPTASPSQSPSLMPSQAPSGAPTASPSQSPSLMPSQAPSGAPTASPSQNPSQSPTSDDQIMAIVFDDTNGNGVIDRNVDMPVQGTLCRLRNAALTVVAASVTEEDGTCSFGQVAAFGGFPLTLEIEAPDGKVFLTPENGKAKLLGFNVDANTVVFVALLQDGEGPKCEGLADCVVYYVLFGWLF